MKKEFKVIADLLPKNVRVLDVGCGDGSLMSLLIKEKNIQARGLELVEKNVKEILLNYNLYKEKAIRGRNHIIETFNWDKITSEYEKAIHKAIRSFHDVNV